MRPMWIAALIVIGLALFAADRAFEYWHPDAYEVFAKVAWTVEGLFFAIALIGGTYRYLQGTP
jgi:hypothetical protein